MQNITIGRIFVGGPEYHAVINRRAIDPLLRQVRQIPGLPHRPVILLEKRRALKLPVGIDGDRVAAAIDLPTIDSFYVLHTDQVTLIFYHTFRYHQQQLRRPPLFLYKV